MKNRRKACSVLCGETCRFGTCAPAVNAFLSENKIKRKKIYLLVCNGGNIRNTWKNFHKALEGNEIVSELDLVYPIRNGIQDAKNKVNQCIKKAMK